MLQGHLARDYIGSLNSTGVSPVFLTGKGTMSATPSEVPDLNAADQTDASPQLSPEIPRRFILLDFDVVRAYGLSPQAGWLYACLKSYADYETGTAFPAKETLASLLQLTQGRSIDKYIAELGDRGLITEVHRRYCNPADKRDWVLDQPDHVHTAQTSNLYVVNMRPESAQVRGACGPAPTNKNPLTTLIHLVLPRPPRKRPRSTLSRRPATLWICRSQTNTATAKERRSPDRSTPTGRRTTRIEQRQPHSVSTWTTRPTFSGKQCQPAVSIGDAGDQRSPSS